MSTSEPFLLRLEALSRAERNDVLREFQRRLIDGQGPFGRPGDAESARVQVFETQNAMALHYRFPVGQLCVVLNFSDQIQSLRLTLSAGQWEVLIDSGAPRWGGDGLGVMPQVYAPCPLEFPARSLTFLQRLNYEN